MTLSFVICVILGAITGTFVYRYLKGRKPSVPPVRSCFILGILKSVHETPNDWTEVTDSFSYRHTGGMVIGANFNEGGFDCYYASGIDLNRDDHKGVREAIGHLRYVKQASLRAPFEQLGCPDRTISTL